MLLFESIELLLHILWYRVFVVSSNPRVLQSSCSVIAERRWVSAELKEKVFRQRCEVISEIPLNWLALNILQLHAVVLTLFIARMLATS